MELQQILLINAAMLSAMFVALWLLSLKAQDASIVDMAWGLTFVVSAWLSLLVSGVGSPKSWLIVTIVSIWGTRLSAYLTWRNLGKPEDHRYRALREKRGARFPLVSLFTVFLLQAAIAWVVALPVQAGISLGGPVSVLSWLGVLLWAIGLFFESVGDLQLARFKSDPANHGRVMDSGLWRYTRHPNYFGDFLVWWGIYLVAWDQQTWWWTFVGPLLMSILLRWVSGARHLESSLQPRVQGYSEYVRRTSTFFPLPPKA